MTPPKCIACLELPRGVSPYRALSATFGSGRDCLLCTPCAQSHTVSRRDPDEWLANRARLFEARRWRARLASISIAEPSYGMAIDAFVEPKRKRARKR